MNNLEYGTERIPPQSLDVERTVLGSMLADVNCVSIAVEKLDETSFHMRANREIFTTMKSMFERNVTIDIVTIAEELKKNRLLDDVGGEPYIGELAQSIATFSNIEYYCGILIEKATARNLIKNAAEITLECYEGRKNKDELIDYAESKIFDVSAKNDLQRNTIYSMHSVVMDTIDDMSIRHDPKSEYGYKTGLKELDDMIGYFSESEYIILAGRPANGKTALMLTIAVNMALDGIKVGIISLEMTRKQLGYRINSIFSEVSVFKMMHGYTSRSDAPVIQESFSKMVDLPIWVDDTARVGIMKVRSTIRQMMRKHGCQIFFIDHLHMMDYKRREEYAELSEISGWVFKTKKEFNIPIILLCQLDKPDRRKKIGRPTSADLRGTGALHQDAETIMFVHRPELYEEKEDKKRELSGVAEIIIDKSRNGPTGIADVMFDKTTVQFKNMTERF